MDNLLGRLNDVFEDAAPGLSVNAECKAAATKVAAWLGLGSSQPLIPLQAAQVLLADGDVRSPAIGAVMKPFKGILQEEWGTVAPHEHKLLALKCLLLTAWDKDQMCRGSYRAFGLAGSSWWTIPSRHGNTARRIGDLLKACSIPLLKTHPEDPKPISAATTGNFTTAKAALDRIPTESQQTPPSTALTSLATASQAIITANLAVEKELRDHLRSLDVRERLSELSDTTELLWWAHARYGYHRREPLRQLPNAASKQWWAAYELAARTGPPHAEPAASLLVETLIALGVEPNEKRSLRDWLTDLHETLQSEVSVPELSERLAAHAEECALGLPITWLRMNAENALDLVKLVEQTQVSLDTEVPSWQWSSWLLRECLLDQLVG